MKTFFNNRRTWYVLIALLSLVVVFHPLLLPTFAIPLIRCDQPVDADYLLFLRAAKGSEEAYTFAAEFVREHPDRRVLVMHDYVRRAEAIGATPSFVETTITMLEQQGIPTDQIDVIGDGNVMTVTEVLDYTAGWLASQPESAQLIVVTHRFATGYNLDIAADAIESRLRERIHIIGFTKHNVDERNWWKSATGLKLLIREQLRLVHLWVFGDRRPNIDWDPDAYEQSLILRNGND